MSDWIPACPDDFKTANNTWQEAFRAALDSLPKSANVRGGLQLKGGVYRDPVNGDYSNPDSVPLHIHVDRKVDIWGRGGGFRCPATILIGGFFFEQEAAGSRCRDFGLKEAAGDAIYTQGMIELDTLHITGAAGYAVVFDGAAPYNCNGSHARLIRVEECGNGGFYGWGGDAGSIVLDHCWVLGLTGGVQIVPLDVNQNPITFEVPQEADGSYLPQKIEATRLAAEAFAATLVPPLHAAALRRDRSLWGFFDRPEVRGFCYEGANTFTMFSPLCEWSGQPQPNRPPNELFAPNTRGFYIEPNGGGAHVTLAHDESGGLAAQIYGTITGGNYARGLERVPNRPPPLRLIGHGDVGQFTMHLSTPNGEYRGALQLGPNGASHFALLDSSDRGVFVAPTPPGHASPGIEIMGPDQVAVMRFPTAPGAKDRMVIQDGARLTSDVFAGPRVHSWEAIGSSWWAKIGARLLAFAKSWSPHDELARDMNGRVIEGVYDAQGTYVSGGLWALEDPPTPPAVENHKVGDFVWSSSTHPHVLGWKCCLVLVTPPNTVPRRYEKRMVAFGARVP